ncbi:hypothetical protein GGS21DRAFT_304930 [Xylaria nigripes]|nr:hypothetical protein GGS21DRAFT_304930 [Xylaria nigripes]
MAYSNELVGGMPPMIRWQPQQLQPRRQQLRQNLKSQPFDPDDLRRRLNLVIAEREAQEKRQKREADTLAEKRTHGEKEHRPNLEGGLTTAVTKTTWAVSEATAHAERPSKLKAKPSLQDRLRYKAFATAAARTDEVGYRHVPEHAAAQFSRTTSATGRQPDSHIERLSSSAFCNYSEGATSSHCENIEPNVMPSKRRSLLQRARGHRERQEESVDGDDAISRRRSCRSRPRPGEATRVEADGAPATTDLRLRTYQSHVGDDGGILSSADTLIDSTAVNEHRVDWTQRDELPLREKRGMRFHPLLRKTTSILTLKGKLVKLRRGSEKNKVAAVVAIQEEVAERAEDVEVDDVDADDGSTPMSPDSENSRYSGRLNVWGRLRRS